MPQPDAQFLAEFLRFRLDAAAFAVAAGAACYGCQLLVGRRAPEAPFSRATCGLVGGLVIGGAVLAEWVGSALDFSAGSPSASLAIARAVALGAAGFLVAVLLASTTSLTLVQAELRKRAAAERDLQQAKLAADSANRAKSDFLAVVSHEIRTPLNAVMGFANLLGETGLDETQRAYLETITGEGRRLSSLINDVLDLSKIEEGRLVIERVPFAPVETIHEVFGLLHERAIERKLDLRFEAQVAGPLMIAGDPLRFRQVALNLLDNAIKFTPKGSITLFLTWQPARPGLTQGELGVRVIDTGVGIPEARQRDLFQMFMQADVSTTRRYGGTGLGLAICQRLVRLMGGEIVVRSKPGEGSEFSFALPAVSVAWPEEEEISLMVPSSSSPFPRRPRVLVVDDMETNRFLLDAFLSRNGFDPEVATGGDEAVRLASARRYDAILMDLHMPEVDGFTATQRIRAAEPADRHTPIIALTATIVQGTREKCLAVGMDDHFTKPLDLPKFKVVLGNIVAPQAAARSRAELAESPAANATMSAMAALADRDQVASLPPFAAAT